ncbi:37991_t:CDS:2, partial [Gigaspora margarita]
IQVEILNWIKQVWAEAVSIIDIDLDTSINDTIILNKYWYKWNMVAKEAANKHIPITKSAPRPFHAFSFKAINYTKP